MTGAMIIAGVVGGYSLALVFFWALCRSVGFELDEPVVGRRTHPLLWTDEEDEPDDE